MPATHSKIIAAAAQAELGPLGFRQDGRSRLWLADHGSWLNVVQFTPGRWSKSVSLMNAPHWLWSGTGILSFDHCVPSKGRAQFETAVQFERAVVEIAREAAEIASQIEEKFSSFDAIADFVVDQAIGSERMRPSWWGYQAGIAAGLQNRFEDAEYFLRGITDYRVVEHAKPLLSVLNRPTSFRDKVNELVAQQRAHLKLPSLDCFPF